MEVTKRKIYRTKKRNKGKKDRGGVWCGIMIHEPPPPAELNVVILQKARVQSGCCIL